MEINWEVFLPFVSSLLIVIGSQVYSWRRLAVQNQRDMSEIDQIEGESRGRFEDRLLKWVELLEKLNEKSQGKVVKLETANAALVLDKQSLNADIEMVRAENWRLKADLEDCEEELARNG